MPFFGHFFYNRAKMHIIQNFLKVVVHVIIIDQLKQTARLYEIRVHVTVLYSRTIIDSLDVRGPCNEEGCL